MFYQDVSPYLTLIRLQTRMQVLSSATAYNGVIQGTYKMASGEGLLSLWRGMSSVVAGAGPAHAVYFATYEAVKHVMGGNQAGVHHPLAAGMSTCRIWATQVYERLLMPVSYSNKWRMCDNCKRRAHEPL